VYLWSLRTAAAKPARAKILPEMTNLIGGGAGLRVPMSVRNQS